SKLSKKILSCVGSDYALFRAVCAGMRGRKLTKWRRRGRWRRGQQRAATHNDHAECLECENSAKHTATDHGDGDFSIWKCNNGKRDFLQFWHRIRKRVLNCQRG